MMIWSFPACLLASGLPLGGNNTGPTLEFQGINGSAGAADSTFHPGRRYLIWRNNHAYDEHLRGIIDRVNVA
jgi:hypothetical protein